MNIRRFEFKDQSIVFDWWNLEGLKKQLGIYTKASDWTQRLLNNEFAFTVEKDNKAIAVIEFLALYQSGVGNIAKAFYFTPYEEVEYFIQDEMVKKAQELKKYKITQVQFYQWKPILTELWLPQLETEQEGKQEGSEEIKQVKEIQEVKEPKKRIRKHGSNKSKQENEQSNTTANTNQSRSLAAR